MNFDIELVETKTHLYTSIEARTSEEAVTIAEGMKSDGDEGEVIEVEQVSVDAYPVPEEV